MVGKVGKGLVTGLIFFMILMFQIATGFATVIVTGVLDTVMINELGIPATLVGILLAVDFIAQPFRPYAGSLSDRFSIFGRHRTPFIFISGTIMCLTYPAMILVVEQLRNPNFHKEAGEIASSISKYSVNPLWLALAIVIFIINGMGIAMMGTIAMSLTVDITKEKVRGILGAISWVLLIFGIVVGSIVSSAITPETEGRTFVYSSLYPFFLYIVPGVLFVMVIISCIGSWIKEPRIDGPIIRGRTHVTFRQGLKVVSSNQQARWFFLFLFTMMTFMFMRDILAPSFAGNVFRMTVKDRTALQSVINGPLLVAMIVTGFLTLKFSKKFSCYGGLGLGIVGIVIQAVAAFTFKPDAVALKAYEVASQQFSNKEISVEAWNAAVQAWNSSISGSRGIFTVGLIIMGIGLGVAVPGLIGMMMDLTDPANAALYMGIWGLSQAMGQNLSSILAGAFRDIAFEMFKTDLGIGYGFIFLIQAAGMGLAMWILSVVNVAKFKAELAQEVAAHEKQLAAEAVRA